MPLLFVRLPNYIGDAVMALPALQLLQAEGFDVHLLGKPWINDLFGVYDWPRTILPKTVREQVALLKSLRGSRLAQGLVFTNSFSSALAFWRAGLSTAGFAKELRSPFLTKALPLNSHQHQAEQYLHLARSLTGSSASLPQQIHWPIFTEDQQAAKKLLQSQGISMPFILVCPFAGGNFQGKEKVWPLFAAFISVLIEQGYRVVCCPGPAEVQAASGLHNKLLVLQGVSLRGSMAIAKQAKIVVSNDSGSAHLAAAAGAHVVSVLRWPEQLSTVRPVTPHSTTVMVENAWPSVEQVFAAMQAHMVLAEGTKIKGSPTL